MRRVSVTICELERNSRLDLVFSENRTTEISAGKEVLVIVSTLIVERASPRHAGNYSCVVPGKAKTTVAVHVLNGEYVLYVNTSATLSLYSFSLSLVLRGEGEFCRHVDSYLSKLSEVSLHSRETSNHYARYGLTILKVKSRRNWMSSFHLELVSTISSLSDFRSAIGARILYAQNCISEFKRTITRSYIRQVLSEIEVTLAFKGDFDYTKGKYIYI